MMMDRETANGRRVMIGTAIGFTLGTIVTLNPVGGLVGAMIGAGAGAGVHQLREEMELNRKVTSLHILMT